MLVAWKYRQRDTLIQRLDPRARLIFLGCMFAAFAIAQIWDIRLLLPIFLLTVALFLMARIEWMDIRRAIIYFSIFIVVIIGVNALLSGRGGPMAVLNDTSVPLFKVTLFQIGTWAPTILITRLRIYFAITQILRMYTMALLAIPIPYTIDPSLYGISFRQMGMPDKPSFTMDLAFRFIPTLARDFAITMDAQRARGYELDSLKGGIVSRLRKLAPLLVPVTLQSIFMGEDVIDAMDLRAFGARARTWIRKLHYAPRDYVFIGLGVTILVGLIVLKILGYGAFWIPPFLT